VAQRQRFYWDDPINNCPEKCDGYN
jgi:hypothetical protein